MKVKLEKGFWQVQEYEVTAEGGELCFTAPQESFRLPIREIRQFSLVESGDGLERFYLDTAEGSYEGRFLGSGDSRELIRLLRAYGYRAETNLTAE